MRLVRAFFAGARRVLAGARVLFLAALVFFAAVALFATLFLFAVALFAVALFGAAFFGAAFFVAADLERVFVDAPAFDPVRLVVFAFAAMATSWSIHLNVSTGMQLFNG